MVSRLAYWDAWNWNGIYNYFSAGNNSSWSMTLPHNKFHPAIFDKQQEELSWGTGGCRYGASQSMVHVGSHECVMCVRTIPEGWVVGMEVSSISAGAAALWHGECRMPGHVDMWRQTMMTRGYKCQDTWIVWGGWQMWEEGCWDMGMCGDGGIWMCLVQGVTHFLEGTQHREGFTLPHRYH